MREQTRTPQNRARSDLVGRNVLVLTKDFYEGRDVQFVLQRTGAKVIGPVHDVASALRAIAARTLSCAVIDAAFGLEDHHRIASALFDKDIPFITLAAAASMMLPDYLSGAPWVGKPTDCRALPGLVASMTRRRTGVTTQ